MHMAQMGIHTEAYVQHVAHVQAPTLVLCKQTAIPELLLNLLAMPWPCVNAAEEVTCRGCFLAGFKPLQNMCAASWRRAPGA